MSFRILMNIFGFMIGAFAICASAMAQTAPSPSVGSPQELRVVTRVLPPMVTSEDGKLSGFSIELWNEIARRLNVRFNYQIAPDVRAQLEQVKKGEADVGIAAISITAAREADFDFSQPILNSGLQIIVNSQGRQGEGNARAS